MIQTDMKLELALFLCIVALPAHATAQTAEAVSVVVRNGAQEVRLDAPDLAKLPRRVVDTTDGGRAVRFEGVRLSDVLEQAGVTFGQTMRGARLGTYVLARAGDGYQVVFALPEIDPDFAERDIIIADRQDSRPLPARDGPLRIIAPGDQRHARWVRGLQALEIHAAPDTKPDAR